jgi:hypothetical protein
MMFNVNELDYLTACVTDARNIQAAAYSADRLIVVQKLHALRTEAEQKAKAENIPADCPF